MGGLRQIHDDCQELRDIMSYRTLCRRFRHGKLGVGKPARETDKCQICGCWDRVIQKKLVHMVRTVGGELLAAEALQSTQ